MPTVFGDLGSSDFTLPAFNWASRPSPADHSGRLIRITDVGVHGSLYFSDGTRWIHESPIIYQQEAKGWIIPSLAAANAATYSQTGTTITVTSAGHNIPATAHDGKDVYLAISSGDAVAGWYSNFTRVDDNTFTCESSVSQTTSGTVNTNNAATVVTPVTKSIFGGLLGLNGGLRSELQFSWFASGNVKTIRAKLETTDYYIGSVTTQGNLWTSGRTIRNRNSENFQISQNAAINTGGLFSSIPALNINTASDFNHSISMAVSSANEYAALESILLEVIPT